MYLSHYKNLSGAENVATEVKADASGRMAKVDVLNATRNTEPVAFCPTVGLEHLPANRRPFFLSLLLCDQQKTFSDVITGDLQSSMS